MMISIPWGVFELEDIFGYTKWHPNHNLKMTPEEQFESNLKDGIFNGLNIRSSYGYYDGKKEMP